MKKCVFQIWCADDPADHARWIAFWESWPHREIFSHPKYVRLFANKTDRALCATLESDQGCVIYPFVFRDLTKEPFWLKGIPAATDIVTPWGWGGPCFWGNGDPNVLAKEFWVQFDLWAGRKNIVSEYVRYTLFQDTVINYPGTKIERAQHVICDLEPDENTIWMNFRPQVRQYVKKTQSMGIHVETDCSGERFDDFWDVYAHTMKRCQAHAFSRSFFEQIHQDFAGKFIYFYAIHDGNVVSADLALLSPKNIYLFLAGTYENKLRIHPSVLLKYETILWAKKRGFLRYILGGGNEDGDGIFQFKRRFSPDGLVPRYEGRRIFRQDLYDKLVEQKKAWMLSQGKEWTPASDHFPAYRA